VFDQSGFIETYNQHGVVHNLNPISAAFVEFSKTCDGTVLDIGSAMGIATLPVLEHSKASVIACDISQDHLNAPVEKVKIIEQTNKQCLFIEKITIGSR
jgi:2-polyprenyl-3-methyl-5-hydroxy-6-metoxy-1,4-benzoquinol methylase